MRRRCLNPYEARLDSLSIGAPPCLRPSRGRADDVGLSKQSHGWIDGDGLGYGPAVLALSSDLPSLVHNQRSRICSVNANPQAAEPSNAFPAIRRLVSGDRGLVVVDWHSNRFRHPRSPEHSMCKAGCRRSFRSEPLLLYSAVRASLGEFHWWMEYGRNSSPFRVPTLVRTISPVLWCLVLASGCWIAAMRLFQGRIAPTIESRHKYRLHVIDVAVVALYVFVIHRWDKSLNPPSNYDECAADRLYGLGCIHGTVMDESGKPISHIEVDLIPVHKTGDARWYGTHSEWTDDQGRYNLNRMEPGEYLLGANAFSSFGAPDAERPFATAYYPAGENESEAALVKVVRPSPLRVSPLRLRKLEVVIIKINVLWADGTRPERSNIYFKNVLYPRHGGTAPQIDNGTGKSTLPKSLEYDAVASVECDAGKAY